MSTVTFKYTGGATFTKYIDNYITTPYDDYWELVEKARKWDNLMKLLEADKK